jgi:hypothetical protein
MMPSDVPLFASVDTSSFHGFAASKRRPAIVVVDTVLVVVEVVVGRLVDVDVLVEDDEVDADVLDDEVDVDELDVDVELLDDVEVAGAVDVAGRVLDVLVVEVDVVVVFLFRAMAVVAQRQPPHGSPPVQSAVVSHSSPAATSRRPSPQVEAAAVKRRRFAVRAERVPASVAHAVSSTLAASRTPRSAPQADQRARTVATELRRVTRTRAGPHSSAIVALPSASTTIASNGSAVDGRNAGSTRKRMPGQGAAAAPAAGRATTNAATSTSAQRATIVALSTLAGRRCAAMRCRQATRPRRRSPVVRRGGALECGWRDVGRMGRGQPVQTSDREDGAPVPSVRTRRGLRMPYVRWRARSEGLVAYVLDEVGDLPADLAPARRGVEAIEVAEEIVLVLAERVAVLVRLVLEVPDACLPLLEIDVAALVLPAVAPSRAVPIEHAAAGAAGDRGDDEQCDEQAAIVHEPGTRPPSDDLSTWSRPP